MKQFALRVLWFLCRLQLLALPLLLVQLVVYLIPLWDRAQREAPAALAGVIVRVVAVAALTALALLLLLRGPIRERQPGQLFFRAERWVLGLILLGRASLEFVLLDMGRGLFRGEAAELALQLAIAERIANGVWGLVLLIWHGVASLRAGRLAPEEDA